MESVPSDLDHEMTPLRASDPTTPLPVKLLVAGGFAVGKTTFVSAISEIDPLTTEAAMTTESLGIDDAGATPKTATTVAMDFGRITLDGGLILYLFGTPGQDRFWFMWDELARGAMGAVVLVDTRRLDDCFAAVDYFEALDLPFVVGINCFNGVAAHAAREVREALAVSPEIPIVLCDARERGSVKQALVVLVENALERARASAASVS